MIKGLENFNFIKVDTACQHCQYYNNKKCNNKDDCFWKTLEQALQQLEIINNSNSSEALKWVKKLEKHLFNNMNVEINNYDKSYQYVTLCNEELYFDDSIDEYEIINFLQNKTPILNTIKQALLKAQEQEKVLKILKSGKYIPLDKINPRFWDDKKDYDVIVTYDFYLWLCEEECEYVIKKEQKLTKKEFDLLKRWLKTNEEKTR